MKRRGERRTVWGEGWLLAAALVLVLALSFCVRAGRQPPERYAPPLHETDAAALQRAGKLNLNLASIEELDEIPGIGPALAGAIVAHRAENGPFESVDDLLDVDGIGEGVLAEIRPELYVE